LLRTHEKLRGHGSDVEFCSKLDGLLQEADESQLWLELLRDDCGIQCEILDPLLRDTGELLAVFTSMVSKLRKAERGNSEIWAGNRFSFSAF